VFAIVDTSKTKKTSKSAQMTVITLLQQGTSKSEVKRLIKEEFGYTVSFLKSGTFTIRLDDKHVA